MFQPATSRGPPNGLLKPRFASGQPTILHSNSEPKKRHFLAEPVSRERSPPSAVSLMRTNSTHSRLAAVEYFSVSDIFSCLETYGNCNVQASQTAAHQADRQGDSRPQPKPRPGGRAFAARTFSEVLTPERPQETPSQETDQ